MLILGIESTCDETGAAVVEDGVKVLSNVVASSVDLQKKYGGVVPEVAAREQIKVIIPVIEEAIIKAAQIRSTKSAFRLETRSRRAIRNNFLNQEILNWIKKNIDAIAISYGPGLIGSLLIGVETTKALAFAWEKPLTPVNHLIGHIYASWLTTTVYGKWQIENSKYLETINHKQYTINFPVMGLIVSGGHTDLVLMRRHGEFKLVGTTLDDSAGEAFDKVARLLGLDYPGGPEIERVAQQLTTDKEQLTFDLPRPMINSDNFNFSFSGLKTAVVNLVKGSPASRAQRGEQLTVNRKVKIASEFQRAVVDVLVKKTIKAAEEFGCKSIVIGGGVAANTLLCSQLTDHGSRIGIKVYFPSKNLSVDNGAMIAAAAYFVNKKVDPQKLSADPSLHF